MANGYFYFLPANGDFFINSISCGIVKIVGQPKASFNGSRKNSKSEQFPNKFPPPTAKLVFKTNLKSLVGLALTRARG